MQYVFYKGHLGEVYTYTVAYIAPFCQNYMWGETLNVHIHGR